LKKEVIVVNIVPEALPLGLTISLIDSFKRQLNMVFIVEALSILIIGGVKLTALGLALKWMARY
jgi:hypothetical protein